jgi:hypothetical protein
MKNSNDTIGNRSRDFPVFRVVPQPLSYRVPHIISALYKFNKNHDKLAKETVASDVHQIFILNLVLLLRILSSH